MCLDFNSIVGEIVIELIPDPDCGQPIQIVWKTREALVYAYIRKRAKLSNKRENDLVIPSFLSYIVVISHLL
jgi:hypothetical protein